MNKPACAKNRISGEREKLTSTKDGDDDEKSDDSHKQIVVVNRTIKSKIFLDSSKGKKEEKKCTSYVRNAKGPVSKLEKKKNGNPCGDAPLTQIIKRDDNNNNNKTGNFIKAAFTSSQFRGLQGGHSTVIPKHQKFVQRSEQKNHIGGSPNEKRECVDHDFFNELTNSTCVKNKESINDNVCDDPSRATSHEATKEMDLHNGNKKKVGKLGRDTHFNKVNEETEVDYLPPCHRGKYPLEERSSHSSQHNKVEYPWADDPPLRGANPSVHFALASEEEDAFTAHPNDEATSPVIKYDQFELYEIDREIEKITEEENKIQEKLIYLTNQELDLVIKMKQMRGARMLSQKEGQTVEWDRVSHNADKG
ncbi:conserved Plasmodium protein, unknown function [Plasmodium knowlesi strain H]|uniref:Uncharacterized protein n=3 Tax=Plasmodium knowlesi TaxID=5850 RepID=A0A5K1U8P0_PLAKH|nr:conserved Plasmodium protein, unknown function [Plasmodium knowlesi strain H]OTN64870.1 Uncharacterized protein PKNOH_S120130500 [Plasmodium knowlesi]CAA9988168.1 conserved Plasmodium protein, unknown function [Plasmodium knowlesi strain H]SBO20075.1 conserved Plasmodium protein, unknown function [Plasmodium knowlesi strain H]SBO20733.1 conserved Plasmodium protein, unknown function [Plasmodium knowlesi strain H]VVS77642.1 conserved Plasmodium protein, unknown function [Plasmodium knowlesi |eukprot:XP_002259144.1 hypothetical protein, conserved in Plasmodium species [Plasmodium knowlesi strain H]